MRFPTPILHLIILYGLPDFILYVFMSFLYYCYLLFYLSISVFISLIFFCIYFSELIFKKCVGLSAHCKLHRSTFQFCGILSPSGVEKHILLELWWLLLLLLDTMLDLPSKFLKRKSDQNDCIDIFKHWFASFIGNWMYGKIKRTHWNRF